MTELFRDAERANLYSALQEKFAARHIYRVDKTNPYSKFDIFNYRAFRYEPIKFKY
uniref:Uncharacterized protein n=5 Tax=Arsenophonus nasoniae TaxID=638 RepID=D2TXJ3_9GAMM|nr:hypothetical protein ARN_08160 [Arsenophonus nasoniae]